MNLLDSDLYAGFSRADTIAGASGSWFPCQETGTITKLTDVINGSLIETGLTASEGATAGIHVRAEAGVSPITGTTPVAPGDKDFIILASAKGRNSSGDVGGTCGFYWYENAVMQVVAHPYYARVDQVRSLPYGPHLTRVDGRVYTHAAVKRGGFFEHYVSTGRGLVDKFSVDVDLGTPSHYSLGHGGYGTPQPETTRVSNLQAWVNNPPVSGAVTYAQDYTGLLTLIFSKGAPSRESVIAGLGWLENDWGDPVGGVKRLYPGWIGSY